ncbi:hypothetical protein [Hymenobacter guriensis]|uniref:DUF4276 family protein n=1 Tax=Hymenobacter guriensis TaxID=2793065 RepID=A0ABS0L9H8_9BACT|nr:hypothetical protein [Hymenobacter guriensis]MBG8556199.1 hypothetical protein [Hymenobacter guriensis]
MPLRVTIVADGSSDQALKAIVEWLLEQHLPIEEAFEVVVADLRQVPRPPSQPKERLRQSWQLFPGDVLFVHRDAEKEPLVVRQQQIDEWVATSFIAPPDYVKVIPVRMTEAWLLTDEAAIREAAGNPNGTMPLHLPASSRLEALPDPKEVLLAALRIATGNTVRRRRSFNERQAVHLVADFTRDNGFQALRVLESFRMLETEVNHFIQQHYYYPIKT